MNRNVYNLLRFRLRIVFAKLVTLTEVVHDVMRLTVEDCEALLDSRQVYMVVPPAKLLQLRHFNLLKILQQSDHGAVRCGKSLLDLRTLLIRVLNRLHIF